MARYWQILINESKYWAILLSNYLIPLRSWECTSCIDLKMKKAHKVDFIRRVIRFKLASQRELVDLDIFKGAVILLGVTVFNNDWQ